MKNLFFTLLLAFCSLAAFAQNDEKAIAAAVDKLRAAMLSDNESDLNQLTSAKLSYGHSNGLMEDKKEFIRTIVSGEANFTRIELSEQTISLSGNVALVRHKLIGETHNKGKEPGPIKLGVLLVWQKEAGQWQLLARQAFKLP